MYKATEIFGLLLVLLAVVALVIGFVWGVPTQFTVAGYISNTFMQLAVGAAMAYASRQKQAGTEIGHKTYPATCVAFLLWLLMFYRWWMA